MAKAVCSIQAAPGIRPASKSTYWPTTRSASPTPPPRPSQPMRTIACSFIITIDAKNKGKATNNGPPINDLRLSLCKRIKPRYRVVVLCRTVQQHALDMVPSHALSRHSNVLVGILVRMPDDSSAYLDLSIEGPTTALRMPDDSSAGCGPRSTGQPSPPPEEQRRSPHSRWPSAYLLPRR